MLCSRQGKEGKERKDGTGGEDGEDGAGDAAGRVSYGEMREGFRRFAHVELSKAEAHALFEHFARDAAGTIDATALMTALLKVPMAKLVGGRRRNSYTPIVAVKPAKAPAAQSLGAIAEAAATKKAKRARRPMSRGDAAIIIQRNRHRVRAKVARQDFAGHFHTLELRVGGTDPAQGPSAPYSYLSALCSWSS